MDDNETNRGVLLSYLRDFDFEAKALPGGELALWEITPKQASGKKKYDLALTDYKMPEMDGYTAAAEIRKNEIYRNIPIIAMTADAMVGVREKVLEIGMNDYVTKPFDPVQLWSVLVKWIVPVDEDKQRLSAKKQQNKDIKNEESEIPKIKGICSAKGLELVGNNKKLYKNLLLKFYEEFKTADDDIRNLMAKNERDTAGRIVHTIKGAAGNLGAEKLMQKAEILNNELKSSRQDMECSLFVDFNKELRSLLNSISGCFENIKEPEKINNLKTEMGMEELKTNFMMLKDKVKKHQAKCCLEIISKLENLILPEQLKNNMLEAFSLVKKYRFKDAERLIDEIIYTL